MRAAAVHFNIHAFPVSSSAPPLPATLELSRALQDPASPFPESPSSLCQSPTIAGRGGRWLETHGGCYASLLPGQAVRISHYFGCDHDFQKAALPTDDRWN